MATRRKKGDSRNLIIGILIAIVATQAYVLFSDKGRAWFAKTVVKKPQSPQPVAAKRAKPPVAKTVSLPPEERPVPLKPVPQLPPAEKPRGTGAKIAIIIDDWGYNANHCQYLAQIDGPVTVAVLPRLPHSKDIAECAYEHNKEVMLHLPLEPHHNMDKYPQDYIIKTSMSRVKVKELLNQALESIPHAVGVNNHMGSKATEDKRLMSILFEELAKKNLFFVDSFVTSDSVCTALAQESKISFTQRDVFLDNENERSYIEKQFAQLARIARSRGRAVGIGHDRALTLQIIKEQTDALRKEGFEIVTLRRLLNSQ